jgi:transposase
MEKKLQITAAGSPVDQVNAIKIADEIANRILTKRTDILAVIVGRRIARETFQGIARAESEALESVGATTYAVRTAVVQRVCHATLTKEMESQIKHDVRSRASKRGVPFAAGRVKSVEACRLTDWTEEMDTQLELLSTIVLHVGGSHNGMPDWREIAAQMNNDFSTNFTHTQWMHRLDHLVRMAAKAA